MKDLTQFLVKNLADHPEQASVEDSESEGTVTFKLVVAEEDKGKIIGKKGKVIKAIRSVVGAAAVKAQKQALVDID